MEDKTQNKYIPGQCNIGKYESEKRLKVGVFSGIMWFGLSFIFQIIAFPAFIEVILLFAFAYSSILGFLQYYNKFCVYYGLRQVFNFKDIENLTKINALDSISADKVKALRLILISGLVATLYSLMYLFLFI